MKFLLVSLIITVVNGFGKWFGNCGTFSSSCVPENPVSGEDYLALSAADKKAKIMENVLANTESAEWFGTLEAAGLMTERMCPTFSETGDELPWEGYLTKGHRKKLIHSVGVVAAIEWKSVGDHPYTGVFKGSEHAIIRMSLAKQPDPEVKETAPGIGLKFLRDGMDSGNMVAMFSVDGQQSWNFFRNNFTNDIPPLESAALVPLGIKFSTATKTIGNVGLSNMAMYGQSGVKEEPNFPFSLNFVPTLDGFPDDYVENVNDQLMTIPNGSTLYKVYAMNAPAELGGTESYIADLVMTSELTTSHWGDRRLFFRHQNMADDVSFKPEWDEHLFKWTSGIQTCGHLSLL